MYKNNNNNTEKDGATNFNCFKKAETLSGNEISSRKRQDVKTSIFYVFRGV